MADRPILFSASMVRALLAGTKTQTRRTMPDQSLFRDGSLGPEIWSGFMGWQNISWAMENRGACGKGVLPRISIGDRLYVREAWCAQPGFDKLKPSLIYDDDTNILYMADQAWMLTPDDMTRAGKTRPSLFMPRWASRITLIVTDVRVERLQEITHQDAIAEGVEPYDGIDANCHGWRDYSDPEMKHWVNPYVSYATLWDSINKENQWRDNPWVVAYSFDVIKQNIDQIEQVAA